MATKKFHPQPNSSTDPITQRAKYFHNTVALRTYFVSRRTVSDVDTPVNMMGTLLISTHLRSAWSGHAPYGDDGLPDSRMPPFICASE